MVAISHPFYKTGNWGETNDLPEEEPSLKSMIPWRQNLCSFHPTHSAAQHLWVISLLSTLLDPSPWAWQSDFTSSRHKVMESSACYFWNTLHLAPCSPSGYLLWGEPAPMLWEHSGSPVQSSYDKEQPGRNFPKGEPCWKWPCRPVRPKVTTVPNNILTPAWDRPHTRITQLSAKWPVSTVRDDKCLLLF